jgi:hypothetical protein
MIAGCDVCVHDGRVCVWETSIENARGHGTTDEKRILYNAIYSHFALSPP